MIREYIEKVIIAAIEYEKESIADFYYEIWESHGYLILLPKVGANDVTINLGHIVIKDNRIFGNNQISISELEKRLNKI
ncbi:hypothetical protein J4455_03770 [Candidatus Woesearchaeota archaeon]|nr:hypothetical protein [Candidatus Woesearchaeota archaeon]